MTTDFVNVTYQYKTNSGLFKRTVEAIPPEKWFEKPSEDLNHLLWVAGHLLHTRTLVLKLLGVEYPLSWAAIFGRGAKQAPNDQYPTPAEILRAWDDVASRLENGLEGATAEQLARDLPQTSPAPPPFDGKVSGRIAFLSLHEAYHLGQLGLLRKWLGYGQAVG